MAYTKTNWENGVTPANATNMNHIEQGIYDNSLKTDTIGDLTNLETDTKTNIVSAINELKDGDIYSTTEVKTNKVWINGKSIYKMAAQFNNYGTLQQDAYISFPISNIETITFQYLEYYYTPEDAWVPFPLIESNGNTLGYKYKITDGQIKFAGQGSWSGTNRPMNFTIEYTKTTD